MVCGYFSPPEFIEWCSQRTKKTKCGERPNGPDYFDAAGFVCRKQKRNKYTCLICGTERRQDEPSNGPLTDNLAGFSKPGKPFAEEHRAVNARVRASSKHTSTQPRGEDGEMTEVRDFDEDFPNKHRFARMVYMDCSIPAHTRKPATREYYEGLDPCHTPPEAETLARIIYSIEDEMNAELVTILNQERSKTGGIFLGEQSDMTSRNRTSHITLNGSVMHHCDAKSHLQAFGRRPNCSHS